MTTGLLARTPVRWAAIILAGSLGTLAVAGIAAQAAEQRPGLTFLVFALTTAPVLFGGAWVLLPDPKVSREGVVTEDSVEQEWTLRAGLAAFLDLFIALGLATFVESILGERLVPLFVFLLLGMADFGLRYAMYSRRES